MGEEPGLPVGGDPHPLRGEDPFPLAGPVEVIAHRGFSARAPENTLAALELALAAGADAVEFDLHSTADGVPVLLHDDTLDRTTDRVGPIADLRLEELAGVDAGRWFSEAYAGEPLPTLAVAFARLGSTSVRIYPEVKRSRRPEDLDRIVELARAAGVVDRTVFISMDWDALDRIRTVAPEASIGYIVERPARALEALDLAADDERALVDFDARILLAFPDHARQARARGVPLAAWTVNTRRTASRLLDLGVPRITTNEVAELVHWKRSL